MRPLLVILSSCKKKGDPEWDLVLDLAVAAEFIHTASLIHDDILDHADSRRGHPTINSVHGNHTAVLAGDYLFAAAFEIIAACRRPEVLSLMTAAIQDMCEGEIEQKKSQFDPKITLEDYLKRIEKKTASLLAACCGAGALAGGADPETVASASTFGRNLGMSYQIIDDLLDFVAEESTAGKPTGKDLAQGILTLPVIYLLQDSVHQERVSELIMKKSCCPSDLDYIMQAVRETGALAFAYQKAVQFAEKARACIAVLPSESYRVILLTLVGQILARNF